MFLPFVLFIIFAADIWLGWALWGWMGVVGFLLFVPLSLLLLIGGGLAIGLVTLLFGKHSERKKWKKFFIGFLKGWGWLAVLAWLSPWLLFSALNLTNQMAPATLPRITISNGEKTVIFQSMMHIASPGFYDDIRRDMEGLVGKDTVFFYEGVRPGTTESMKKLSALLGTEISSDMYDVLAKIAGLTFQGDEDFIDILPSTNVDLSTDEIIAIAEKNTVTESPQNTDIIEYLEQKYPSFTPFQKSVSLVLARGGLNILLRTYTHTGFDQELQNILPIYQVLLDERNKNLSKAIQDAPVKNIYIHYGAMHYAGVLKNLQETDPRWQEIARTEFTVIR